MRRRERSFPCVFLRKQAWLWSLGDTYRIKDRPRYMSAYGGNSAMDTGTSNSLRYSVGNVPGDNNEVCDRLLKLSFPYTTSLLIISRKKKKEKSRKVID